MVYIPDRGDIIKISLNPVVGNEMQGDLRPALVITPKRLNILTGLVMVCPITQGNATVARENGFLVSLMGFGLHTSGSVVSHQVRTLDWKNRVCKKIETAPTDLVQEVQDILTAMIND